MVDSSVKSTIGSITIICTLICLISFFVSIFYTIQDKSIQIVWIKYSSLLSLILFLLSSSLQISILTVSNDKYLIEVTIVSNMVIWAFGQTLMYTLFTLRLFHTFKGTILQIKDNSIKTIKIVLIMFVALFILYSTLSILVYFKIIQWFIYSILSSIMIWIAEIFDLFVSIILIYMFVSRLFKLFIMNTDDKVIKIYENDDGSGNDRLSINLNCDQKSILQLVTKYTILSIITIISSQIFLMSTINRSISLNTNNNHYINAYILCSILLTFDCCINSICILLNFKFSHSWYIKICCSCDKCAHFICTNYAIKKLKNNYQEKQRLEDNRKQHIVEYNAILSH